MDGFLELVTSAPPIISLIVIVGGLVHVVILLLKNTGVIKNIRNTQVVRTVNEAVSLIDIGEKLDKIAGNHLHGLPDMEKTLERIEIKQDKMIEVLYDIRNNTKTK